MTGLTLSGRGRTSVSLIRCECPLERLGHLLHGDGPVPRVRHERLSYNVCVRFGDRVREAIGVDLLDFTEYVGDGFRVENDEIRKRITVDWTRFADGGGVETSIRLGYEHVTRYAFSDENRSNFLAQVKVGYIW